jgi:hypothetical protein
MTPEPAARTVPSKLNVGFAGAVMGGFGTVFLGVCGPGAAWWRDSYVEMSIVLVGLAALAVIFAIIRPGPWRPTLSLGSLALVLFLALLLYAQCRYVTPTERLIDSGCEYIFEDPLGPWPPVPRPAAVLLLLAPAGAVALLLGRSLAKRTRPFLALLLRIASVCALLSIAALLALVTPRALRWPAPRDYIDSLPVLAVLPPAERAERVDEVPLSEGLVVRRSCPHGDDAVCFVSLDRKGPPPGDGRALAAQKGCGSSLGGCDWTSFPVDARVSLVLREDTAHRQVVVDGADRYGVHPGPIRRVLELDTLEKGARFVADILDTTGPPRGGLPAPSRGSSSLHASRPSAFARSGVSRGSPRRRPACWGRMGGSNSATRARLCVWGRGSGSRQGPCCSWRRHPPAERRGLIEEGRSCRGISR